ncbi:MAG: ATP-binding protein [Sphaerochaeta sp.]
MIESFSVENFRSIKHKQTLSFLPTPKLKNPSDEYLLVKVNDNLSLLKLGLMYGYNASGKSNFLLALRFLQAQAIKGGSGQCVSFGLDPEWEHKPSTFELVFYIEKVRFEYYLELDGTKIYKEQLRHTPKKKIATIYTRTYDAQKKVSDLRLYAVTELTAQDKLILTGNTLENRSVLYAYQKSNIHADVLAKVVNYFNDHLLPMIDPDTRVREWSKGLLHENSELKPFIVSLMKKADVQINDLRTNVIQNISSNTSADIYFTHPTSSGSFQIPYDDESEGTLRYVGLSGVMHELIEHSHFLAIDEFESSLHPDLVTFYIQMFLMNSTSSQLLITTHAQYLMELDFIRNDMIWFAEKNEEGASEYYKAQDCKLHKNINVANFYRAGKLGAKPILGSPLAEEI